MATVGSKKIEIFLWSCQDGRNNKWSKFALSLCCVLQFSRQSVIIIGAKVLDEFEEIALSISSDLLDCIDTVQDLVNKVVSMEAVQPIASISLLYIINTSRFFCSRQRFWMLIIALTLLIEVEILC